MSTKASIAKKGQLPSAVQGVRPKGRKRVDFDKYFVGRPYQLFRRGIRSKGSVEFYNRQLYYFCKFVDLSTEQIVEKYSGYVTIRRERKPNVEGQLELQRLLENYVLRLQERVDAGEIKATSCVSHMPPVKLFCDMNDISLLNWKKINKLLPRSDLTAADEAYTREQIRKMLEHCDLRGKMIILLLATSGIRLGGLAELKIGDLKPIYSPKDQSKVIAFSIKVYRGTEYEYTTFSTPETWAVFLATQQVFD